MSSYFADAAKSVILLCLVVLVKRRIWLLTADFLKCVVLKDVERPVIVDIFPVDTFVQKGWGNEWQR